MIRSFVCSVYLLTVCFAYPIQANDECLINHDLMDEIPSLNNQTTINAGSIQVLSDSTLELRNGFEIKLEDLHVNGDQAVFNDCLLYTSPSPRDATLSRMPSSA